MLLQTSVVVVVVVVVVEKRTLVALVAYMMAFLGLALVNMEVALQ